MKNKNILFIGSESYDAPTITIIQGLSELGYNIYTIKKSNINSWFCNKVILDPSKLSFDFIISNLHWGTRWSYYKKYNLNKYLKILIDGDDNKNYGDWKNKYKIYMKRYKLNPSEYIKNRIISPYRWVEDIKEYTPDIVFSSQKSKDEDSYYLPFGIHNEYYKFSEDNNSYKRKIDITHISGPGIKRKIMSLYLIIIGYFLKIKIFNGYVYGEKEMPNKIKKNIIKDKNIHSYHRWIFNKKYFKILNETKILIYPGVDRFPFYDSKRPWEALANGAFVLFSKPNIDNTSYSFKKISPYCEYKGYIDLFKKIKWLLQDKKRFEKIRYNAEINANKYFSAKSLAKYFLNNIKNHKEKSSFSMNLL